MNVTMRESETSKEEVLSLIGLLDEEYQTLDVDVHIFGSYHVAAKFVAEFLPSFEKKEFIDGLLWNLLVGTLRGMFHSSSNSIFLFEFKMDEEGRKIRVASTLFHEFRHAFQCNQLGVDKFEKEYKESAQKGIPYHERPFETDANHFSISMMNLHNSKINEIIENDDIPWHMSSLSERETDVLKETRKLFPELYPETISVK